MGLFLRDAKTAASLPQEQGLTEEAGNSSSGTRSSHAQGVSSHLLGISSSSVSSGGLPDPSVFRVEWTLMNRLASPCDAQGPTWKLIQTQLGIWMEVES